MTSKSQFTAPKAAIGKLRIVAMLMAMCFSAFVSRPATAQTYNVLLSFAGGATDGQNPHGGLIRDAAGNLYGTTAFGGFSSAGTVFKIDAHGTETVLYNFTGGADGYQPLGILARDGAGNLYGTTQYGGTAKAGVIFKVDNLGNETVLYSFSGGSDGKYPMAGLIGDAAGNIYGTTEYGGVSGSGTVFKLDRTRRLTVLHSFTGGSSDGQTPTGGLLRDSSGNLYGTTQYGGASSHGTVFKIDATGHFTILHSFTWNDGGNPASGVIRDSAGNFYGTTQYGGTGLGVIFKLDAGTNLEHVLHSFTGSTDGSVPTGDLLRDSAGNFYGTTSRGGAISCGTVFKLDNTNHESIVHYFNNFPTDGCTPYGSLVLDAAGNLYGTTYYGSSTGYDNMGIVFKVHP